MIARMQACRWAVVALAGLAGGSCSSDPATGYSFSDAFRSDVQTVAVPVFQNSTFSHGLEFELTDAVVKEIHRVTPWRVAAGDEADSTLVGTITGSELRRLSRESESGLVQEYAVELTVSFEWKRNRTGEVLVSRQGFRAGEAFVPALGARERLNLGERAAIDQMAKDIVSSLRSSW